LSETSGVTRPILDALNKAGYFAMRLNSGSARIGKYWVKLCPAGTADIVVYPPYKLPLWVETKTAKGRTNPEQVQAQAEFAYTVEALGHKYVRATKLDDVLEALK